MVVCAVGENWIATRNFHALFALKTVSPSFKFSLCKSKLPCHDLSTWGHTPAACAQCQGGAGPTSCDQTPGCSMTGQSQGPGAAPCRCWGLAPGSTGSQSGSGQLAIREG